MLVSTNRYEPGPPILATTATANQRVTDDVASQLGPETVVLRTSLDRASLHCSVINLADDAQRLAWVSEHLSEIEGSGIIYTLTADQGERAADFFKQAGHLVEPYSGSTSPEDRVRLEERLRNNELKALVATSALGMGFDKSDMAFCIHLGLPPTPVAYYQQTPWRLNDPRREEQPAGVAQRAERLGRKACVAHERSPRRGVTAAPCNGPRRE